MNKVFIIGNLTRDPEGGSTANGILYCRFTVAVQRRHTDANGQRPADFLNVVCWRVLAENCLNYLSKGRKVAVVGHIETRSYDGNDGQRHYTTEIVAEEVEFMPRRNAAPDEIDE